MASEQTDHLGRVTGTAPSAQTVTAFAVEQGTLDAGDPGVQETLEEEKRRAQQGTERAERISEQLTVQPVEQTRERPRTPPE